MSWIKPILDGLSTLFLSHYKLLAGMVIFSTCPSQPHHQKKLSYQRLFLHCFSRLLVKDFPRKELKNPSDDPIHQISRDGLWICLKSSRPHLEMCLVMFRLWYSIQQMLKQGLTCNSSFCPEFQRLIIKLLVGNPIVIPRGMTVGMHPNPSVPPFTQVEVLELLCQTFAGNPGVMLLLGFAYHPALTHLRT